MYYSSQQMEKKALDGMNWPASKSKYAPKPQANPTPKVETKYAVKRISVAQGFGSTGLIKFSLLGLGINKTGVAAEHATLFDSIAGAVSAVSKRNKENPAFSGDIFTIVKVLITTTPGTRTVRVAKEGERADKWAIGEVAGWLLKNAASPHNWTQIPAEARMFDTRELAARFAVSGSLPSKEWVAGISIVGLVESTTPESVKYDVVEL